MLWKPISVGVLKHIKDNNANVFKKKIFSEVIIRVEYVNI